MREKSVAIRNQAGFHARPASLFVREVAKYQSQITVRKGAKEVDAKSILALMSLAIQQNDVVTLRVEGTDEVEALQKLVELLESATADFT